VGYLRLPLVEVPVRAEAEEEIRQVRDEEDHGDLEREPGLQDLLALGRHAIRSDRVHRDRVEDRGDDEAGRGQGEEGRVHGGGRAIERLGLALQPTREDGHAQHEEHVPDDRAGEGRLHDVVEAALERGERDDQLGRVPEGGVQETADSRAELRRELFGGASHEAGERHDGEPGAPEHGERSKVEALRQDGDRDEHEQELERVLRSEEPRARPRMPGRRFHARGSITAMSRARSLE
jgi:hypothetical protein